MPPEIQAHLFEPFFTTKGGRGSGLGLAAVYGIMRRHSGRVKVVSAPGAGTTVTLSFPRPAPLPVPTPSAEAPQATARASHALRLLVVDDEPAVRQSLAALLRQSGHQVHVAPDGEAALALAMQATFDAVLTDLSMPGLSGAGLAKAIKTRFPRLPVVLLTGWIDEHDIDRGAVDRILIKPISLAALHETLETISPSDTPAR
jgi:CheY-like chemotaxis protein